MNWLEKLRKQNPDRYVAPSYRHGSTFVRHMSDPVLTEKRILLSRGIDAFNVGHTTRESEIEALTEHELRNAQRQLENHVQKQKVFFEQLLQQLQVYREEAERLKTDLQHLNNRIRNLEAQIEEDMEEGDYYEENA